VNPPQGQASFFDGGERGAIMLRLRKRNHVIALGALCLLAFGAESSAEEPAKEKKEKEAITVPAGTPMMIKTGDEVSSKDKPGRRFSATLQANLMSGDEVVAKAGTQVYGQVVSSKTVGRGVVVQHSDLVLGLTDINIEGMMYPIATGSFSENSTGVILQRKGVVIPAGSLLEFRLSQPLTVKK
jgi:hypothetical protein